MFDVLVQERRDADAAERFFRRLLGRAGDAPDAIVTDGRASYGAAKARLPELAAVEHRRVHAATRLNNRVEQSRRPTRLREYVMRRFKSAASAQQFPAPFSRFCNHVRVRRHLGPPVHIASLGTRATQPGARWPWSHRPRDTRAGRAPAARGVRTGGGARAARR